MRIGQISDLALRRAAHTLKKHDLGRRLSIDILRQPHRICHTVPVQIQHNLDRRMCL